VAAACTGSSSPTKPSSRTGSARAPVEPPAPPQGGEQLAVVGDFGTGEPDEVQIADLIDAANARHPFGALLTVGDNIYPQKGNAVRDAWTRPYGWVLRAHLPVVAALGDDDVDLDGTGATSMRALGMPNRWYEKHLGAADVFVLDATRASDPAQKSWFTRAVAGSRAPWKIVLVHFPPYVCSPGRFDSPILDWVPLFERGGIDLVLSGNHHSYQRFAPQHGTTYVITGNGGATLHPVTRAKCTRGAPKLLAFRHGERGFLEIGVSGRRMQVQEVGEHGEVLDRFSPRG
jgi:Calcineurin-like phosphoesterase